MKLLVSVILLLSLACHTAFAQSSANANITAVFADLKPDQPGAAVMAMRNGKIIYQQEFGLTDLEAPAPLTAQTNFRLASFSKQFTAAAVMLLVRDGKLKYDETLKNIFPNFPEYGRTITVRNLLNHTSGLLDYEDLWDAQFPNTPPDKLPQVRDAQVRQILEKQSMTRFAPGTRFAYSNSGYAMLAQIVEARSGQPFEDFMRTRVFEPLGMHDTVEFANTRNIVRHRSYGYRMQNGRLVFSDQSSTSAVLGDGGIYSSLNDLAKWLHALRNHTLLSAQEMEPALAPVNALQFEPAEPRKSISYGFGWFLDPYKGHRRMYHTGETSGFRTAIEYFPDDDLAIVILCNRTDIVPNERALKIADLLLGSRERRSD